MTAEITGFSQVPGRALLCACPGLIPRGTLDARPIQRREDSLPLVPRRRLPDQNLSRLITTAYTLAVYASTRGLPRRYARLASGGRPPLLGRIRTYWARYEGFQVLSNACSFLPSQAWPGARNLFWTYSGPILSPLKIRRVRAPQATRQRFHVRRSARPPGTGSGDPGWLHDPAVAEPGLDRFAGLSPDGRWPPRDAGA